MKFQYASGSRPLEGYTIKRGIGRGGFGEVYFATSDAGKEVALKHVERNLEVELRGVSQCLNLKHLNLIDLYDIRYDEQGDAWVVMEYVAGPSLKDVIDRNPNGLPLDQVCYWFRGIAAGMAYLHDHGIVHRDLKPGNIFDDELSSRSATTACRSSSPPAAAAARPKASARSTTWPRRSARESTAKRSTSTPWASSCTRCSPAACPSRARAARKSS